MAAAVGAVLVVHGARQGSVVLSWVPLRFAGRISYAWYLWHWPLLWLSGTTYGRVSAVPVLVLGLIAAVGSTRWVEEPLRRRWRACEPLGADLLPGHLEERELPG